MSLAKIRMVPMAVPWQHDPHDAAPENANFGFLTLERHLVLFVLDLVPRR